MSTLGKIREKSTLMLIIIGGALVAFILGDLLTSNTRFLGSKGNEIGEISGKTIAYEDFERRVIKSEENYKSNYGVNTIDDNTRDQLRNQVWNQLVNEYVMQKEYEELGITVGSQELYDMVRGIDPHQSVKQAFSDPNSGAFDAARVQQFLKTMDQDPSGATKARWVTFEAGLKQEKVAEKYNNLIKKGLYVTNLQAKQNYLAKNTQVKIEYVVKRYNALADSLVKYEETDLKKYYKENSDKYDQETSRSLEFVSFDINPSEMDLKKAEDQAQRLAEEFKESENDSLFVKLNSDNDFAFDFKSKAQLEDNLVEELFNAEKGKVYGPYKEENALRIAKLIDTKFAPDSVKARHILVKIVDNDTASAMAKIDGFKKIIKGGKKFAELAEKESEDVGSGSKGGDLGWFSEGAMVKPFNDASFSGKKGDMPVVVSQFGVHLIEILDKSSESKKVKIAFIDISLEPSAPTYQGVYATASSFANDNNSAEKFEKAIVEKNMNKRIAENIKETDRSVVGVENSRELVRWAFKANEGDVSKPFEFNGKYVVALLKESKEKGPAPLDKVRDQIISEVVKIKKSESFTKEILDAGTKDLNELAGKINANMDVAENINFSSFAIPGVGREPVVIGTIFGSGKEVTSSPIKGETGVYVFKITDITAPQETTDYSAQKNQLNSGYANRVNYEVFEALKDHAKVEDNRGKFY